VYIGDYPPFKDRVTWAGDLDKKDASINIENIQAVHNGTYICDVKNPPDIVVRPGHIRLHVVEIGNFPQCLMGGRMDGWTVADVMDGWMDGWMVCFVWLAGE
jgi:hypothetical protein